MYILRELLSLFVIITPVALHVSIVVVSETSALLQG